MANTLTGIIPTLYTALNVVSREMVGFIPAVTIDASAARAAKGQTVRSPIGVAGAVEDITPGAAPANTGDTTVDYVDVTISKSRVAPIRWNGEEQLAVGSTGVYNKILADQFADGMRKLINEIEVDLAVCAKEGSSRAYGTAGTAPFGTAGDFSDFAQMRKILDEDGAPKTDLQLVLSLAAMANLRGKQNLLLKANEAGTQEFLRSGYLSAPVEGLRIRDSAGLTLHTKGTGASYQTNSGTTNAVGDVAIPADTGSGTIIAGDVVTFADESPANKYVVNSALSGGSFRIGKPGLRSAIADGKAITVGNSYTPSMAFARSAIVLATRAPAMPTGGDAADDATTLTDPLTGITFEVRVYRQYRQVKYEIGIAWGQVAANGAHIATLLG